MMKVSRALRNNNSNNNKSERANEEKNTIANYPEDKTPAIKVSNVNISLALRPKRKFILEEEGEKQKYRTKKLCHSLKEEEKKRKIILNKRMVQSILAQTKKISGRCSLPNHNTKLRKSWAKRQQLEKEKSACD